MSRLKIELYDTVAMSEKPFLVLEDSQPQFYDLNKYHAADKATRIRVTRGDEYRYGDHVRLYDDVREFNTPTICVDPAMVHHVNLNQVFNNGHFADRAAAISIILNPMEQPHETGRWYSKRIALYDHADQVAPSLVFYDWQFPNSRVELENFHFKGRASRMVYAGAPGRENGIQLFHEKSISSFQAGAYDFSTDTWSMLNNVVEVLDFRPLVIKHPWD